MGDPGREAPERGHPLAPAQITAAALCPRSAARCSTAIPPSRQRIEPK